MADNPDEPDLPHAHRSRAREGSGLVGKGGDLEYIPIAHEQRPWSLLGGQYRGAPVLRHMPTQLRDGGPACIILAALRDDDDRRK